MLNIIFFPLSFLPLLLRKLLNIMDDNSHPLQKLLIKQQSRLSQRLLQLHCNVLPPRKLNCIDALIIQFNFIYLMSFPTYHVPAFVILVTAAATQEFSFGD